VPQRIGIALVPRGNAIALSASGSYSSSCEEATDIQGTRPDPDDRLAETSMVPAGHGHEHQGALPAASPGRSLDRDTTTEYILESPASRSELASRRAPVPSDPTLTRFPSDGHDTKRRRHPNHLIWVTHAHARTGVVTYLPSHSDGSIARARLVFRTDLQRMY
jgi:hypothetical protein